MDLQLAKCTQCGATIKVDNTQEAAICEHCGSAYIVKKAIENYSIVNNINTDVVNIYSGESAQLYHIRAEQLIEEEKYQQALDIYQKIIDEINPEDYLAWKALMTLSLKGIHKFCQLKIYTDSSGKEIEYYYSFSSGGEYSGNSEKYYIGACYFSVDYGYHGYIDYVINKITQCKDVRLYAEYALELAPASEKEDINNFIHVNFVESKKSLEILLEHMQQKRDETIKYNEQRIKKANSGCYIATAVYGSYDCPEVWTLRRFRDQILKTTFLGRSFIKFYYSVSPFLVKIFGNKNWFKSFWKYSLDKFVLRLNNKGINNIFYED